MVTAPDPAPDQLEALKRDRRVVLLAEELYAYEAKIPAHCITCVIPEEYYRAAADLLDRLETIRLQELRAALEQVLISRLPDSVYPEERDRMLAELVEAAAPSRRDLPPRPAGEHGRTGEPCRFCGAPDNDLVWCCEERMVADQGPPGPRPGPVPDGRPAPAELDAGQLAWLAADGTHRGPLHLAMNEVGLDCESYDEDRTDPLCLRMAVELQAEFQADHTSAPAELDEATGDSSG